MKALDHSDSQKIINKKYADLLKMKSQKTFIGSEVRYANIGMLSQTRLHSVVVQVSEADGISMGEAEIRYKVIGRKLQSNL